MMNDDGDGEEAALIFFVCGETLAVLWSVECLCLYCRWRVVDKSTMSSSLEPLGASPDLGFGELFRLMDTNTSRSVAVWSETLLNIVVAKSSDEVQGGGVLRGARERERERSTGTLGMVGTSPPTKNGCGEWRGVCKKNCCMEEGMGRGVGVLPRRGQGCGRILGCSPFWV